jgi:hypothetical protein
VAGGERVQNRLEDLPSAAESMDQQKRGAGGAPFEGNLHQGG